MIKAAFILFSPLFANFQLLKMEDNFNITAESLKTQEDKIISQKATLVAILSEKNAEELAIESLDEGCEILQQQHEMLDQGKL